MSPGLQVNSRLVDAIDAELPQTQCTRCGYPGCRPYAEAIARGEKACIGCTKCIQACPVDAILGASKRMHSIIDAECTGCDLCVPACPVDCISMQMRGDEPLSRPELMQRAQHARRRFDARNRRLDLKQQQRAQRLRGNVQESPTPAVPITRSAVLEAIARGKAKRAGRSADGK